MKKWSLFLMIAASTWAFQSCTNNNDAVKNANEANEEKQDTANATRDTAAAAATTPATTTTTPVNEADSKFMVEAASGGMMEVQLGQLAQEKAQNQRVKDFGAMMVRDHSKANDELKTLAASKNVTLPAAPGDQQQKHIDNLRKKTGADFDKAYIKMMIDDHKDDIDKFEKTANKGTDPDVKSWASKTLPVLRTHLDSAKAVEPIVKK
jgi:putative membrane protein